MNHIREIHRELMPMGYQLSRKINMQSVSVWVFPMEVAAQWKGGCQFYDALDQSSLCACKPLDAKAEPWDEPMEIMFACQRQTQKNEVPTFSFVQGLKCRRAEG